MGADKFRRAGVRAGRPSWWQAMSDFVTEVPPFGTVEIHTYPDGNVLWMSNWAALRELVRAGTLRPGPVHRDLYGHQDYYWVGAPQEEP